MEANSEQLRAVLLHAAELRAEIAQLRGHKEEADRHIKTIAELRHEVDLWKSRTEQGSLIIMANVAKIEQLTAAIQRIDGINDNPAHYNPDINAVCDSILRRDQPGVAGEPEPEDQHEEGDLKGNG